MTTTTQIIADAAALIAKYNPELASCFQAQPFRRVTLANAFAAGFCNESQDDIHPIANIVLRVAYADRNARKVAAKMEAVA